MTWPTTLQRIEFSSRGGGNGVLLAKTSTPSDIQLEVVLYYKLRPEQLSNLYNLYPAQNHQSAFASIVKVSSIAYLIEFDIIGS